jgi:hypothetical protein
MVPLPLLAGGEAPGAVKAGVSAGESKEMGKNKLKYALLLYRYKVIVCCFNGAFWGLNLIFETL